MWGKLSHYHCVVQSLSIAMITCTSCPWAVNTGTYCQGVVIRNCVEPENHWFFMLGLLFDNIQNLKVQTVEPVLPSWIRVHCMDLRNFDIAASCRTRTYQACYILLQLHKLNWDISYNEIWHLWSKKRKQPCYVVTSLDVSPVNNPPQICLYHVCSKVLLNISDDISCLFVRPFYGELLQ